MASIVENADDAIIGKTLDGITASWNPAVEELFGYSNQDIIDESSSLLNIEVEATRRKPSLPRSEPANPSGTSRPRVSERTEPRSKPRSPSHRSATRTVRSSAPP